MAAEDLDREDETKLHAENSYRAAIHDWVVKKSWPRLDAYSLAGSPDETVAILVHHSVSSERDAFKFHSAIHFLEVTATYYGGRRDLLSNLKIWLVVPGYNKEILLASSPTYLLSINDGTKLQVRPALGPIITGHVSLLYMAKAGVQNIALKYDIHVPFAGGDPLNQTVPLAPTDPALTLTTAELETIPVFAYSEVQLEQEVLAYSASTSDVGQTLDDATDSEDECKSHLISMLQFTRH
ncbi:hypothetical protein OG21DRAFT_396945 [Imleria badia]|nr:hypothetical protein OG21DRAFT_396945 [Imleria badia]